MSAREIIQSILPKTSAITEQATAFAPTNIALIKYWGKRHNELNLPVTDSLSLTIAPLGCQTTVNMLNKKTASEDELFINGQKKATTTPAYQRLKTFLDIIRPNNDYYYQIKSKSDVPIAAGIASSACGFAALSKALNQHHQWNLNKSKLSVLARLGSGSACRSLWNGFVQWQQGERTDGLDSHGVALNIPWPELNFGLWISSNHPKPIGSREGMRITQATSPLYKQWPDRVKTDMQQAHKAIASKNFELLGQTLEDNAIAMHECMLKAQPSVNYCMPSTIKHRQAIINARKAGLSIYFSQDAGPNLKCFFRSKDIEKIQQQFPELIIINPWKK